MIPFNPFNPLNPFAPFGILNPMRLQGNAARIARLDTGGIFELCTNAVQLTEESVDFGINPCQYNALPAESLVLLKVRNTVPAGGENLPAMVVTPSSGQSTVSGSSTTAGTNKTPIVDHTGTQVTGANLVNPTEMWAYLNKCTGTLRILSYTATAAPSANASGNTQEAEATPAPASATKAAKQQ